MTNPGPFFRFHFPWGFSLQLLSVRNLPVLFHGHSLEDFLSFFYLRSVYRFYTTIQGIVCKLVVIKDYESAFDAFTLFSNIYGPLYKLRFVDTLRDSASFRRLKSFKVFIFFIAFKFCARYSHIHWKSLSVKAYL